MTTRVDASFGNDTANAAAGKHIHQQNIAMQGELSTALQDLRLELRLMRRDMDTLVQQSAVQAQQLSTQAQQFMAQSQQGWRVWLAMGVLAVALLLAVGVGDRQVTALRSALHETEMQVSSLRSQVSTLQYQVQTLRETR